MSMIKNLMIEEKIIEVEFPDSDGFLVKLSYVGRDKLMKIRNRALVFKFNKRTRQREEEVDNDKFLEEYSREVIRGWKGLTIRELARILPIDTAGADMTASDITDFETAVSNNTDVSANTSARHDAVTVTDSSEIDFTLTGQDITASIVAGSIDETKLDTSVNASLDLADGSVQINDIIKQSYTPTWANVTVGNGTSVGNYVVIGDFVSGEAVLTFGSTTAITGNVYVTLPITPTDTPVLPLGVITVRDTGVRQAGGILHTQTNNDQGLLRIFETSLGYARQLSVNATRPFALSTGDNILVNFYYRIGGTGAGGGIIDP